MILNSCNTSSQTKVESSIWTPNSGYEKKTYDSTLTLVFEENFNDTISLYRDEKYIKDLVIKTNKSAGVVPLFYKVEEILPDTKETFKVIFSNKEESIQIDLGNKYSYAYISRVENGKYFLEYSNFERSYY